MLVYLYRFFRGYVTIKFYGEFPERFINICAFNHLQLWNIRRRKDCIFANISVGDYLKIRSIKKNRSIRIRLIRKKGFYFTIKPYLKRKGLAVGMVAFFAIIYLLSRFIWNIDVVGNKTLRRDEILKYCEEINIKEGVLSSTIDTDTARLQLLMNNEKLSWASFIIEGSHLTVNILETKTVDIRDSTPNNLIADRDGVIEKVSVSGGKAVVKKNQAVLKGDLLVTGALQYSDGATNLVRCDGKVLAKTEREMVCETPYIVYNKKISGRSEKRNILTIFGFDIPLSGKPVSFLHKKEVEIFNITKGTAYSPVFITTVKYNEVVTEPKKLNLYQAKQYLKKKVRALEKEKMNGIEIISFTDEFCETAKGVKLIRKYKCVENIAISEKIKIINVN